MSRSRFPSDQGTCLRPSAPEEHASAESSMPRPCSAAALRNGDGSLADVAVTIANRELLMLGPAGKTRESAFLPDPSSYSDRSGGQRNLPVLIGSGTGAALEEITSHLEKAYGKNFHLAVVDKEESILVQNQVRRRFAVYPGILWVSASSSAFVLKELTLWQQGLGGKALFPLANPFYLRIDPEYSYAVRKSCESCSRDNF